MFWNIRQQEGESVDAYLTRIRLKLEMCESAAEVRQGLARDKFVFGLIDDRTKERLLHEERLDLSTVVAIAQRAESSGKQMREMSTTTHTEINVMQRNRIRMFTVATVGTITSPDNVQHMDKSAASATKPNISQRYVAAD